jgi:hypothetical protein
MKTLFRLVLLCLLTLPAFAQNLQGTILPSLARSATTVTSADQINVQWKGGHFIVNVSAYTSGNYTPTIQGKDPISGNYYTVLAGPAINSTSTTVLLVYPGSAATATGANNFLPRTWRVSLAGASTPVMTFSVGMQLIP